MMHVFINTKIRKYLRLTLYLLLLFHRLNLQVWSKQRKFERQRNRYNKKLCFEGTNSMSGDRSGVQRRCYNDASFSIYVNYRRDRLVYYFFSVCFHVSEWLCLWSMSFYSAFKLTLKRFQRWIQLIQFRFLPKKLALGRCKDIQSLVFTKCLGLNFSVNAYIYWLLLYLFVKQLRRSFYMCTFSKYRKPCEFLPYQLTYMLKKPL